MIENHDLNQDEFEGVELEINGELDLHTFRPKEIKYLIPDYIQLCLEKEIYHIRIIHGKGTGTLRRTVHSILEKIPEVQSFKLAGMDGGSWGATLVNLKKNLPGEGEV